MRTVHVGHGAGGDDAYGVRRELDENALHVVRCKAILLAYGQHSVERRLDRVADRKCLDGGFCDVELAPE
jgi:hypothetical protein